ncbi:MAG: hypothetical protein KME15_09545 [Drouetiella hepatica Uher 2000/2452]|jgi:hypothetical protein|uniref:Fungal lipase-type domain-containing protein n=1 Tax=Drouetiella hepatica Uher 2000/2452 TaxID=904376 RepID=A0A951Q9W9_9CYAN|nr:hypothetical protein [Drouetiella hepatica Uher 2000/2452]
MKLNRRRLLKASLAVGALAATQSSWAKGDVAERHPHSRSHEVGFPNPKTSNLLMQCCLLAASQVVSLPPKFILTDHQNSVQPSGINPELFDRHTQIASFQAQVPHFYEPQFHGVALKLSDQAAIYGKLQNFGLALRSPHHNIIALQISPSDAEWLQYASARPTDFDPHQPEQGQVHSRVKQLYAALKPQIQAVTQHIDPVLPCYVTGYSLGGAIAHLAAAEIALNLPQLREKIQVYSFGAPRLGDRAFATFYDALLPRTYRMVNLADRIPLLPPSRLAYQHIGQQQTYVAQEDTLELNHAIETYRDAARFS